MTERTCAIQFVDGSWNSFTLPKSTKAWGGQLQHLQGPNKERFMTSEDKGVTGVSSWRLCSGIQPRRLLAMEGFRTIPKLGESAGSWCGARPSEMLWRAPSMAMFRRQGSGARRYSSNAKILMNPRTRRNRRCTLSILSMLLSPLRTPPHALARPGRRSRQEFWSHRLLQIFCRESTAISSQLQTPHGWFPHTRAVGSSSRSEMKAAARAESTWSCVMKKGRQRWKSCV